MSSAFSHDNRTLCRRQSAWFKKLFTNKVSEVEFLEKFDTSLKRLNLDYVDILYLHNIKSREAALNPTLLNALEKAKTALRERTAGSEDIASDI